MAIDVEKLYNNEIVLREFIGFDDSERVHRKPEKKRLYFKDFLSWESDFLDFELTDFWEHSFLNSYVWKKSDARQVADISQHPHFQGFYAFPKKRSAEELNRMSEKEKLVEIGKHIKKAIVLVEKAVSLQKSHPITRERENYKLAIIQAPDRKKTDLENYVRKKTIIGYIALDEINEERGVYRDIGCFIHPGYQNEDYALQASQLVLDAFFKNTKYDEIYVTYHPDNIASKRVLQKLGYKKLPGEYFITNTSGIKEPREKCELTSDDFYTHLQFIRVSTEKKRDTVIKSGESA